ncbi:MAG: adenylate/guanylate cyclase domain-containing protein [Clostridiales bacterium]|nr:adenylate/guanylate cyclase domain-containing protein [Clostridiales bacterium]
MKKLQMFIVCSLIGAALISIFCGSVLLQKLDRRCQDALYQNPRRIPNDIVIISIDDRSQAEYGVYSTWDRSIMTGALEALASDPDQLPAVVAIDALLVEKSDQDLDEALASAASKLNVITAGLTDIGGVQSFDRDGIPISAYSEVDYRPPYDLLRKETISGHIQMMYDIDGVMRHASLYLPSDGNSTIYSLPYLTACAFARTRGFEISRPPVNSHGQYYIPFCTKPGNYFTEKSLLDLIKGNIPADCYAGKIVLIGPRSLGLRDHYVTAADRNNQMYGIEIQANLIQNLIDGYYKEEVSDVPQILVLFTLSFIVLMAVFHTNFWYALFFCVVPGIANIPICMLLYDRGYVCHPLWGSVSMGAILVVAVILHYIRVSRQRHYATSTLERYVSPNIVKELLREGTESLGLGGKLCEIAVLFVDVRGFTTMSEKRTPHEIVSILNRYLVMTSDCIEKNEGTLDKFIGDAAMAFWGAPLPQENAVYLAAKAALDILEGAEKLSAALKEEIGEELHVGVGLHFGPAVVGNMGSDKHMDYTAVGDTVNTASRLESTAPGGTVYISRAVAEKLGDAAEVESLGDKIKLKGKAEGFEVLILKSLKG